MEIVIPCKPQASVSPQVSWTRKQDVPTLLTVGLTTYSANDRIFVEHIRHLQNWSLVIKHVQPTDAGVYECQVSTHPPTSIFVKLKVTGEKNVEKNVAGVGLCLSTKKSSIAYL